METTTLTTPISVANIPTATIMSPYISSDKNNFTINFIIFVIWR